MNQVVQRVCDSLAEGNVLLTRSVDLRRVWRQRFGEYQQLGGSAGVWRAPRIWSWAGWLDDLWQSCCYGFSVSENTREDWLLNSAQSKWLWQQILRENGGSFGELENLGEGGQARQAWQAWKLYQSWGFSEERLGKVGSGGSGSREQRLFLSCKRDFEVLLRQQGWLDRACLENRLRDWLVKGLGARDLGANGWRGLGDKDIKVLWLAGFAEQLYPVQIGLLNALRERGVQLRVIPRGRWGRVSLIRGDAFENEEEELLAAVRWARGLALDNSEARIGLAMSNPAEPLVRRLLGSVLQPSKLPNDAAGSAFHMSLGDPLGEHSLVRGAMQLLQLHPGGKVSPEVWYCLLTSRKVAGWKIERWRRLEHWRRLEQRNNFENVSVSRLPYLLKEELSKRMEEWQGWAEGISETASFAEWGLRFHKSLQLLGWMGDDSDWDNSTSQASKVWQECLDKFSSLGLVSGESLDWQSAWRALQGIVQEQRFLPNSPAGPISVVDIQEAAGLEFDYLWVLGVHGENWPQPEKLNPFLDAKLQQQWGVPFSSTKSSLRTAQRLTARLCCSATKVVFSTPAQVQGVPTTPSLLLQSVVEKHPQRLSRSAPPEMERKAESRVPNRMYLERPQLEVLKDSQAPQFVGTNLKGGVSVLRDQSACPFKGFAHHRLKIKSDPLAISGLHSQIQGKFMHRALHLFWQTAKSSANLEPEKQLKTAVHHAIKEALEQDWPNNLSPWLKEQEQQRLEKLMLLWLKEELRRRQHAPFEIKQLEQEQEIKIGELQLTGRIDRVDKLSDGSLVLLDYKIGRSANSKHWMGERPQDPQLPLYAQKLLTEKQSLAGFGFAKISEKEMKFDVWESQPQKILSQGKSTLKISFVDQMEEIQAVLRVLVSEFIIGTATVSPQQQACDRCCLQMFCRIHQHKSLASSTAKPTQTEPTQTEPTQTEFASDE